MNKIIHYIWLGGKKKPRIIKKCIRTWRRFMPDYEIKEWNESNVDLDLCPFVREAYNAKKYAFAADVIRFDVLARYGGLYFDVDVRMLQPLYSLIDECDAFAGYERKNVNPGLVLFAKEPNNYYMTEMVKIYKEQRFILEDGSFNVKVVGDYFTELLMKNGFVNENSLQKLNGITIYPSEFFCPSVGVTDETFFTDNTYTKHLFYASWQTKKYKTKILIQKMLGKRITNFCVKLKAKFRRKK